MTSPVLAGERRADALLWWFGYLIVVGSGLVIAVFARHRINQPYLGVSLALVALMIACWIIQPRITLYATLALTAISDQVTVWWFPFVKNFSSRESISYIADAATISPLDLVLVAGALISMARCYANTGRLIAPNPVTRTVMVFTAFVAYGFGRGLLSGADSRIAVLVGRPLFYVALAFILTVNECREPRHRRNAMLALLIGIIGQSILSIEYLNRITPAARSELASLNEHGSTLGQDLVILAALVAVLFGIRMRSLRWGLTFGFVPVFYVYLVAQRRAGVAALLVAGVVTTVMLFWRHHRRFWVLFPTATVLVIGYLAAFWNSTSKLGFPAQAMKTIIAPNSVTAEDRSSDLYRMMEVWDLNYTIRANPIRGIGIGRAFLRPIELPNISFFELNAYQPHNQVLWIWVALGFFGFVAMLYLLAKSIVVGTAAARTMPLDLDFMTVWLATAFVVMYGVYTYVDVSWDARNTTMLGFAIAVCGSATRPERPSDETPAPRLQAVGSDATTPPTRSA